MIRRLFALTLSAVIFTQTQARELSREVPETYAREIEPLLTPIEDVLDDKGRADDEDGRVLLSEEVTYVHPDGRRTRATHVVYKAYSESGAKSLGSDTYTFSSELMTPHLVLAKTITAGGKEVLVGKDEAFIQSGRGDSSGSLYDDSQQAVIIFSDAKVGSVTQTIIVFDDLAPRFGEELAASLWWNAGWPVALRRSVFDLPESWSERLGVHTVGSVKPVHAKLDAPDGRVRMEWKKRNLQTTLSEPSELPVTQGGPVTLLSTWQNWERFTQWYKQELDGREELDPELAKLVDEWTGELKEPREILGCLHQKVAEEVRYTGLEFGRAGLQPYDCNLVWKRQFGDCKDKSNLLVAMLRHKGINAWVALVNTEHAGIVHKASPSHLHFDHVIAVVDLGTPEKQDLIFCDPTISKGVPGLLSPSSSAREVLLVDTAETRWLRSPENDAGELEYVFDLTMEKDGRISGWLEFKSRGYYTYGYLSRYEDLKQDAAKNYAAETVSAFFEAAETVDLEIPEVPENPDDPSFHMRAFFTTPSGGPDSEGRMALAFPMPEFLFPDFGDTEKRRTPYYTWSDESLIRVKMKIPAGFSAEALPKPLKLETPAYSIMAEWKRGEEADVYEAILKIDCLKNLVPADEVDGAAQANRAFSHWAKIPLVLSKGDAPEIAVETEEGVSMPLMTSGEGQLDLVDRWYPLGDDPKKRKSAFRDVIRFFPDSPETVFMAKAGIAYVDYYHDNMEEAEQAYSVLTKSRPRGVAKESFDYTRYMHAVVHQEMGRTADGFAIVKAIAEDEDSSEFRRGWSATMAGEWVEKKEEAIGFYRLALELEGSFRTRASIGLIAALVATENSDGAVDAISEFLPTEGEEAEGMIDGLVEALREESSGGAEKLEKVFSVALEKLSETDDPRAEFLEEAARKAGSLRKSLEAFPRMREAVVDLLEGYAGDRFDRAEIKEGLETREDFEAHLDSLYDKKHDEWLAHMKEYFLRFEAGEKFSFYLWKTTGYINWFEKPGSGEEPIFEEFAAICRGIPHADENYWECLFVEAEWLEIRERWSEAVPIYASMFDDPDFDSDFEHSAAHRKAIALENLGKRSEAIEYHTKFQENRREFGTVCEHLLRAGVLLADAGMREEALNTWSLLKDVPESIYEGDELELQIRDAIILASDRDATLELWERTDAWWEKDFLPLCETMGFKLRKDPPLILTAAETTAAHEKMIVALEAKDLETVGDLSHRMAISSRFLVSQASDLYALLYSRARAVDPEKTDDWERCIAAYAGAVGRDHGCEASLRFLSRLEIAVRLDLGESDRSLELASAELGLLDREEDAEHYERCVYIYAMAAKAAGKDLENATERLKGLCAGDLAYLDRASVVNHCVAMMRDLDQPDEILAFLGSQIEMLDPAANADLIKSLTGQRELLSRQFATGENFKLAVEDWLGVHKPKWFDHVNPNKIGPEELSQFESVLGGSAVDLHDIETFRLLVLSALSPEVLPEHAEEAFVRAVLMRGEFSNSYKELADIVVHVLDDERFSENLSFLLCWRSAVRLSFAGRKEQLSRITSHERWKLLNDRLKDQGRRELEEAAAALSAEPAEIVALIRRSGSSGELDAITFGTISILYSRLVELGDEAATKEVRGMVSDWEFAPATGARATTVRLEMSRTERNSKEARELNGEMLSKFEDVLRPLAERAPSDWRDRIDFREMEDLSKEVRNSCLAAKIIHKHQDAPLDPSYWVIGMELWAENKEGDVVPERLLEGLSVLLEGAPSDSVRSWVIGMLYNYWVDLEADDMRKVRDIVKPWHDLSDHPLAYIAIQGLEDLDRKPGEKIDTSGFEAAVANADMLKSMPAALGIMAFLTNEDAEGLEKFMDQVDYEILLDPTALSQALKGSKELEREEEIEVIVESIEETVADHVHDSWLRPDAFSAIQAFLLAEQIDRADLLPEAWILEMGRCFPRERTQLDIAMSLALLRKDWKAVEESAVSILKDHPEDLETVGLLGMSLLEQGKKAEALPHLKEAASISPFIQKSVYDFRELLRQAE